MLKKGAVVALLDTCDKDEVRSKEMIQFFLACFVLDAPLTDILLIGFLIVSSEIWTPVSSSRQNFLSSSPCYTIEDYHEKTFVRNPDSSSSWRVYDPLEHHQKV